MCFREQGTGNRELIQGPDLRNTFIEVLLEIWRFLQEKVAFLADVKAMFYQVQVQDGHRDFLCFLWWPGGDTNKPLETFKMKVHVFGAVLYLSTVNFALQQTARVNSKMTKMAKR